MLNMTYRHEKKHDLTIPCQYIDNEKDVKPGLQESSEAYNKYLLHDREIQSQRTQIRISFDAWVRRRHGLDYARLRGRHAVLTFPSAEQAELAIELIRNVCKSLEGKWLAK